MDALGLVNVLRMDGPDGWTPVGEAKPWDIYQATVTILGVKHG
jgi:hypothetical protein